MAVCLYRINVMEGIVLKFVQGVCCIREFCVHAIMNYSEVFYDIDVLKFYLFHCTEF